MQILTVGTIDGTEDTTVYDCFDFPYEMLDSANVYDPSRKKNDKGAVYSRYTAAFDIETTTITPEILKTDKNGKPVYVRPPWAFMYQWQFCINGIVCFGRTWEEYLTFIERLSRALELSEHRILIVWVHNLAFEFQFLYRFQEFTDVFARAARKPIRALTKGFEYRCSYALSNMSLAKFCENYHAFHYKKEDKYNYRKIRTYKTELTAEELDYCFCDVKGLCECINNLCLQEDRDLVHLPMTNTGFVREEYRTACLSNRAYHWRIEAQELDLGTYRLCRKAFRGGNTHTNRYLTGKIVGPGASVDIASSYPCQIAKRLFPSSRFTDMLFEVDGSGEGWLKFRSFIYGKDLTGKGRDYRYKDRGCIMSLIFWNLTCKEEVAVPYIDRSHCTIFPNRASERDQMLLLDDNGRCLMYKSAWTAITMTEVDFKIIERQYTWDKIVIKDFRTCHMKPLPIEIRRTMMLFYERKTAYKGDDDHAYEYMKSKNRLNSTYGMMVTNILQGVVEFDGSGGWHEPAIPDEALALAQYYQRYTSFLSYPWGVWVTAYAREQLQEMLDLVGDDVIYCDTDSVKMLHPEKYADAIRLINERLEAEARSLDVPGVATKDGKDYVLGIWDDDGTFEKFRSWGAKKYATQTGDKFKITVAGMSKKLGAIRIGNIENFELGRTFSGVGRTIAWYNNDDIHEETVDGVTFTTAANIGILDTTYTLDITDEYWNVIDSAQSTARKDKMGGYL